MEVPQIKAILIGALLLVIQTEEIFVYKKLLTV
jgi:hypothetical protein